tara:strand:+ start:401 stop:1078 length:678 start_codon:yes stop_codon:yes gene_type:complete
MKQDFKFIDRGKKHILVLIYGWAMDERIFSTLDLNFNYILPLSSIKNSFEKDLFDYLNENDFKDVSLLGWSLGSFLAVNFATQYQDLVDQVYLISIREKYDEDKIGQIKEMLKENKKAYLYSFYSECLNDCGAINWFKKNLLKTYIKDFSLESLLKGLDFLKELSLDKEKLLKVKKLKIINGSLDRIAPLDEVLRWRKELGEVKFTVIDGCGHAPFLLKDFNKYL